MECPLWRLASKTRKEGPDFRHGQKVTLPLRQRARTRLSPSRRSKSLTAFSPFLKPPKRAPTRKARTQSVTKIRQVRNRSRTRRLDNRAKGNPIPPAWQGALQVPRPSTMRVSTLAGTHAPSRGWGSHSRQRENSPLLGTVALGFVTT